jgi:hypothetical protein
MDGFVMHGDYKVIGFFFYLLFSRAPRRNINERQKIKELFLSYNLYQGDTIAQAVSRWLPISATRVRPRVW